MGEGIVSTMECQEEIKVASDYWRCVKSRRLWMVTVCSLKAM